MRLTRLSILLAILVQSNASFAASNDQSPRGDPFQELRDLVDEVNQFVHDSFYTKDEVYTKGEVDALISNATTDSDGDGVFNINDDFPLDAFEWLDTDSDGTGNNADLDDDDDGVPDLLDAFPLNNSETVDTDGDELGNNSDLDDDNDGILDVDDEFPLSALNAHRLLLASASGSDHICAITSVGVQCWGGDNATVYNNYGQLTVPNLVNPYQISTQGYHNCALDETGVHCWGDNSNGESSVPSMIDPMFVSAGYGHTCAIDRLSGGKSVICWGTNYSGQTNVPSLTNPKWVSSGQEFTCAFDDTGVNCWGGNSHDQTNVPPLQNPVALASGAFHACAIDSTSSGNEVVCWGSSTCQNPNGGSYCATNLPYIPYTSVPAEVVNPTQISSGVWHSCALHDGGVSCWGRDGFTTVPTGLNDPIYVSAGETGTCVIDREISGDGVLKCSSYLTTPSGITFDLD